MERNSHKEGHVDSGHILTIPILAKSSLIVFYTHARWWESDCTEANVATLGCSHPRGSFCREFARPTHPGMGFLVNLCVEPIRCAGGPSLLGQWSR